MKLAVTDANIFIDLLHIDLLAELFGIDIEIHTTLNVIDELNEKQQNSVLTFTEKKKLTVHPPNDDLIPEVIKTNKRLSPSDKSVFGTALRLEAIMLTGDNVLRNISITQNIEVHGILWLFDRFVEAKLITKKQAIEQLNQLRIYNSRLPHEDCEKRIAEWS